MKFTAQAIATATGGALRGGGAPPPQEAGAIVTDSRTVRAPDWFVALVGEKHDAHAFLEDVARQGCGGAVATRVPAGWTLPWVEVPDTLVALQDLGRAVRAGFGGPVVGITGSAGKTTTRVMVAELLAALGGVHHTRGNLNNHVGVPLTLLAFAPPAASMVLEMGMSHPGEIALLADIGRPTVRLVTNVGAAHVEGCGSLAGVAAAKQELFDSARPGDVCCVNLDDPFVSAMPLPAGTRRVGWGRHPDATVRLVDAEVDGVALTTRLHVRTPDGDVRATLPVPGLHLAHNATAAIAIAHTLGVPVETMGPALARYAPEGMRNRVTLLGGHRVIDDAYNANPTSMDAALRLLASLPGPRVAVLGDMLELGAVEAESHREVLACAVSLGLDAVHVAGPRMTAAADAFPDVRAHADPEALADALLPSLAPSTAILVKGSRGARMERVTDRLRGAP